MRVGFNIVALVLLMVVPAVGSAQTAGQGDSGRRQFFSGLLDEGRRLSEQGYYYEACVAFNGILERGEPVEAYYQEAEFGMAVNLRSLGLLYSSFVYFARIVDSGEDHPYFAKTIPWLLNIARQLPGFQGAREYLAQFEPTLFPEDSRNELAYMVGQYLYSVDSLEAALDVLRLIDRKQEEFHIKGRYLQGVVHARLNAAQESLEEFKEILRYQRDTGSRTKMMQDMYARTIMSMARIFYSTGDFEAALKYYDQIEKYSSLWLDAIFEKGWTYFRMGNYERAMGNLHTLNSPYFEEQYFPESRVLQAVILYTNCRFEDAILVVDQFVKEYDGLRKDLKTQLEQNQDPADFYYWLSSLAQKGQEFSKMLKRIFNLALADRKLHRRFAFIVSLEREERLLESMRQSTVQKELAERLLAELVTYRELAIGETGELAMGRLDLKRRELQRLVSQAMKVKFEALNALKQIIEGDREAATLAGVSRGFRVKTDDEHMAWPFEGEYWKDELDSYLFRVDNLCPKK